MRIAIIGGGISGLSAAWRLGEVAHVTLYEKNARLGGHAHTQIADYPGHGPISVDTGFIVYNEPTYPNLTGFFQTLGVTTELSDMSLGFSIDGGRLEYSGHNLRGIFAQPLNVLKPDFLHLLGEIFRFWKEARVLLNGSSTESLGAWLTRLKFSSSFVRHHIAPTGGAIWSCTPAEMLNFPARSLAVFFDNHRLLGMKDRILWRTVRGGSRNYIQALQKRWNVQALISAPVRQIQRRPEGVSVRTDAGAELYDQVVLACHSDEALALLGDASAPERAVLGAIGYRANRAVLHCDPALMPKRRAAWASWNCMVEKDASGQDCMAVTYWMNRLQNIPENTPLFVTLNPRARPDPARVFQETEYHHPQFDAAAVAAQKTIGSIQGINRTWFCGAWCGYGFHEDGISSAMAVADALAAPRLWDVRPEASPAYAHAQIRTRR